MTKSTRKRSAVDDAKRVTFHSKVAWKNSKGESRSYQNVIWQIIVAGMSKTPSQRVKELTDILDERGTNTGRALAAQLRAVIAKIDKMDDEWASGIVNAMAGSVDVYVERMLPRYISAMIYELTIEGLMTSTESALSYQEHLRAAAGLKTTLSVDTENFIAKVHSRLIDVPRRERNQVRPGGSASPLRQYAGALSFHYERLRPIWKDAKKIFKHNGGGDKGRAAVREKYRDLNRDDRWTKGRADYVGLPEELINKLSSDRGAEESRPQYLAYEHAAHLCGFGIGENRAKRNKTVYSVKQISRIIREHKLELGAEYYDSLFRNT